MTDKELKRLNRSELLEILLDQAQEIEQLNAQIDDLKKKLEDKTILINESGSIAEASIKLTNIFEEAQKAADLYLENTKMLVEEKEIGADTYEKEHKAKADEIMAKSMEESKKMLFDAKAESDKMKEEASKEASKTLEDAKEEAAKAVADSKARASEILEKTKAKCEEMENKAKEESQAYWEKVRRKIQSVLDQQKSLKDLFDQFGEITGENINDPDQ